MSCATHNCSILKGNSSQNLFLYRYIIEGVSKANQTKKKKFSDRLKIPLWLHVEEGRRMLKFYPLQRLMIFLAILE